MEINCPHCSHSKEVDESTLPKQKIDAKCPKCNNVFLIDLTIQAEPPNDDFEITVRPAEAIDTEMYDSYIICVYCGSKPNANSEICEKCGHKVEDLGNYTLEKLSNRAHILQLNGYKDDLFLANYINNFIIKHFPCSNEARYAVENLKNSKHVRCIKNGDNNEFATLLLFVLPIMALVLILWPYYHQYHANAGNISGMVAEVTVFMDFYKDKIVPIIGAIIGIWLCIITVRISNKKIT